MGFSHLLKTSTQLDADDRHNVEVIAQSSRSLMRLVNDVLDISALDTGAVSLEKRAFSLRQLIERTIAALDLEAKAKALTLELECADLAEFYEGDEARLEQVLFNLVGNAIKFTDKGGAKLVVQARPQGEHTHIIECRVIDTGVGIAPEQMGLLFNRFVQADGSIRRRYGGSGLGLSIAKSIIELMGGEVGVSSAPGQGATFWFRLALPLARRHQPPRAAANTHAPARILVVDDLDINRDLVRALLAPQGHVLEEAASGEDAIARARSGGFDLVLMDVQMPGMSGLEAARELATFLPDTPIIAMTANALPEQIAACEAAGMSGYIAKPFDPAVLPQLITQHVQAASAPVAFAIPEALRNQFVERARQDLAELFAILQTRDHGDEARGIMHRLAGAGGSFGFPELSALALEIEQKLTGNAELTEPELHRLAALLPPLSRAS